MLLSCCAACPPSGSPRRATAHRSVRFVGVLVPAFCPPYDSNRAEHTLERDASVADKLFRLRRDHRGFLLPRPGIQDELGDLACRIPDESDPGVIFVVDGEFVA